MTKTFGRKTTRRQQPIILELLTQETTAQVRQPRIQKSNRCL